MPVLPEKPLQLLKSGISIIFLGCRRISGEILVDGVISLVFARTFVEAILYYMEVSFRRATVAHLVVAQTCRKILHDKGYEVSLSGSTVN